MWCVLQSVRVVLPGCVPWLRKGALPFHRVVFNFPHTYKHGGTAKLMKRFFVRAFFPRAHMLLTHTHTHKLLSLCVVCLSACLLVVAAIHALPTSVCATSHIVEPPKRIHSHCCNRYS